MPIPARQAPPPAAPARAAAPAPKPRRAPVIEEAAILYANGQAMQALTALKAAVAADNLGDSALQVWLMLFDLQQHLGMKEEFEALGMEFLVKFERSPPVWVEVETKFNPALATGGFGYCAITGVLSDASASELEQLRRIGQRQHALRIDFSKLQGVDPHGAAMLLEILDVLKLSGKAVIITGDTQLLGILDGLCQVGKRETDGVLWSLLFEILRRLDQQERFEEAAVNYAVTYEVSPPSWEPLTAAPQKKETKAAPAEPAQPVVRLSGELTGATEALAKKLKDWAVVNKSVNGPMVIDMAAVRRVDFATAGHILNILSKLHESGVVIQVRGASELIAALFEVMDLQRFARIIHKR